jgi:hypothetical protein
MLRLLLATVVTLAATTRPAIAAEPRHTVIAVLEYRAGAKGVPGIGDRLAALLAANAALDVIGPKEARLKAGARLDADVARCSGESMCIGAIGEGLGAQEVLIIGISQLGDVVLAMQRIDAKRGDAKARLAESIGPNDALTDEQLLGWLRQLFPADVFKRYGQIRILSDVSGAEVRLNEEAQGTTPVPEIKVRAPGSYKVRLTKSGFAPFEAGIDVLPDATVEVRARLVRETGPLPWYKRWYVWAAVGGAVAAAGIAVAVYFGTRVDETPMGFIRLPNGSGGASAQPIGLTIRY